MDSLLRIILVVLKGPETPYLTFGYVVPDARSDCWSGVCLSRCL